jgi:hypothetical protein
MVAGSSRHRKQQQQQQVVAAAAPEAAWAQVLGTSCLLLMAQPQAVQRQGQQRQ